MAGYSPDVQIYLITEDQEIRVSWIMGELLMVHDTEYEMLPAGTECKLLIFIGKHGHQQKIRLMDDVKPDGDQEIFRFKVKEGYESKAD